MNPAEGRGSPVSSDSPITTIRHRRSLPYRQRNAVRSGVALYPNGHAGSM